MRVIPICTVDKNLLGAFAKSKAALALTFPFLAAFYNLFFLADINAISDIEKTPFKIIKNNINKISIFD